MIEIEYQWSDIWLLQSIILGGGEKSASLYNIISTGDALNHAIFTNDELESGFSRLSSGGLIFEKEKIFFPTEMGYELYKKAEKKGGSIYSIRKRLENLLKAKALRSKANIPKLKGQFIISWLLSRGS